MNVLEAIDERKSIRRFKAQAVPEEALQTILKTATRALSDKNRQPWRFVVIAGKMREKMVRIMRNQIDKMIAAVSLGYADETLAARPRKPVENVTKWM